MVEWLLHVFSLNYCARSSESREDASGVYVV